MGYGVMCKDLMFGGISGLNYRVMVLNYVDPPLDPLDVEPSDSLKDILR